MLVGLVMFFIALLLLIVVNGHNLRAETKEVVLLEKQCPPHKWVRLEQPEANGSYLRCSICKAFPGSDKGVLE